MNPPTPVALNGSLSLIAYPWSTFDFSFVDSALV